MVVAEKDEGENKRFDVLVTKVDKPKMIEEANAVRDSESDPNEEDGLSHPGNGRRAGKNYHRDCTQVLRVSKAPIKKRARQREQSTWSERTVRL